MPGYLRAPLVDLRELLAARPALQDLLSVSTTDAARTRIHYREASDDGSHPPPRCIIGVEEGMSIVIDASPHVENLNLWCMLELPTPDELEFDVAAQEEWLIARLDTLLVELRDEIQKRNGLSITRVRVDHDPYAVRREMAPNPEESPVVLDFWFCQLTFEVR